MKITFNELRNIFALYERGYGGAEIARHLKLKSPTVYYHIRNSALYEYRGHGAAGASPEVRARVARLGGIGLLKKRGRKHMSKMGKKGGAVASADRERMRAIGRLGGAAKARKLRETI